MKSLIILCGFLSLTIGLAAQSKTVTIKVAGSCEMCKTKIEKTALGTGAVNAAWDAETQLLSLTINEKTNTLDIEKAIAATGYDTEHIQGDATAYSNLPHCCQYERTAVYNEEKAGCCKSHGDSAACSNKDDMTTTCSKHNDNKDASCCAPLADGSKADCCKADKACCSSDKDHASCCGKDAKCATTGCCKADMSCCAAVKAGDTCCAGGKCSHNN